MKTRNSMINSIVTMIQYIVMMVTGFISQKIFINILGTEYLGLNGLFNNIITMLGIIELGVGSAIIYNLYKPIVNNDYKTINSLMNFYKKAYDVIAFIIFIIGLIIVPFLSKIIRNITIDVNIYLVYILFLLDVVASYILTYKRSILYADQKNYIVNITHMIYYILLNVFQLIYLYYTMNYYGYLIIKIIMRLIENIIITIYVNNKYKFLDNNNDKLDNNILNDIKKKVKALLFHKIGGFVVLGSDNIIISRYLGLVVVGLYSNYYLIIDSVNRLFGQAITAVTPSVGHLLINDNKQKNFEIFKKIRFINFWIATFAGIGLLLVINPFISIWLGSDYLLSFIVLIILVFNFYQKMMRNTYNSFKDAAGIYYEDRFVPVLESITNLFVSVVLVKIIGLSGVFIGTIVSGFWLWFYSYPKYIYQSLFGRSYYEYLKETIGYILLFTIILSFSLFISNIYIFNSMYYELIKNIMITLIVPNIIIAIIFKNSENYKYCRELVKKILLKSGIIKK